VLGNTNSEEISGTLLRFGINLLEENRLKLEIQPVFTKTIMQSNDYKVYSGISYTLNEYLSLRSMYWYDHYANERSIIGQLYFYRRI
jgi:hypothetical protein